MAISFRGGIFFDPIGSEQNVPLEEMSAPAIVCIPLSQHKGKAAKCIVKVGERVLKGQMLAEAQGEVSVSVHASVSGEITKIESSPTPFGEGDCIWIENDFKEELHPSVVPFSTPISKADPQDLIDFIQTKGLAGLGASFPVAEKIRLSQGRAKVIIINCMETEPYLSAAGRVMLEKAEEVIGGAKILMKAIGAEKTVFALEKTSEEIIDHVQTLLGGSESFFVSSFEPKYPQGDERQLIVALLEKEVQKDAFTSDAGAVVFSAETCWALYRAFVTGLPSVSRFVSVNGDCIKTPANFLVPIGTLLRDVIHRAGGLKGKPDLLLAGGPITGVKVNTEEIPITKEVGAVLALTGKNKKETNCIRCGRCADACPMHLLPAMYLRAEEKKNVAALRKFRLDICNDCGCCTYVCPAGIPLREIIGKAKDLLSENRAEESRKGETNGSDPQ